jgi:hypothetical protein
MKLDGADWRVPVTRLIPQSGFGEVVVRCFRSFRVLKAIVIGLSDLGYAFNGIFKRSRRLLSGFHSSVFAKLAQQRSDVADRTDRRLGNM